MLVRKVHRGQHQQEFYDLIKTVIRNVKQNKRNKISRIMYIVKNNHIHRTFLIFVEVSDNIILMHYVCTTGKNEANFSSGDMLGHHYDLDIRRL